MKKTLTLIALLIVFVSCKSYKDFRGYATNDNSDCFNDEIFQIKEVRKKLNENSVKYLRESYALDKSIDSLNIKIDEGVWCFKNVYDDGFNCQKWSAKKLIIQKIDYDSEGNIMKVNFCLNTNGFNIYKEIEYNKEGEITKKDFINYNICWKEALAIAKHKARKEIELFNITDFDLFGSINKNGKAKWEIQLTINDSDGREKGKRYILINAETGGVLKDFKRKI